MIKKNLNDRGIESSRNLLASLKIDKTDSMSKFIHDDPNINNPINDIGLGYSDNNFYLSPDDNKFYDAEDLGNYDQNVYNKMAFEPDERRQADDLMHTSNEFS
jgi:hypothetical protein